MTGTVLLIGCVKGKLDGSHPAKDLYTSPLFVLRRRYAESLGDRWFILSAHYGLVDPEQIIGTYDLSLKQLTRAHRREWSVRVLAQLDEALDTLPDAVEFHAGSEYRDFGLADALRARGVEVRNPVAGLGIGKQLQWYSIRRR